MPVKVINLDYDIHIPHEYDFADDYTNETLSLKFTQTIQAFRLICPESYNLVYWYILYNEQTPFFQRFQEERVLEEIFPNLDNKQSVIDIIKSSLTKDQTLIDVETGKTKNKHPFVYSIIKTTKLFKQIEYNLTMFLEVDHKILKIEGIFIDYLMTGFKEKMYLLLHKDPIIGYKIDEPFQEPAAQHFQAVEKKYPEQKENMPHDKFLNYLDDLLARIDFPKHPIFQARWIVYCIINYETDESK